MKIQCSSCKKLIDYDSKFCKHYGVKVVEKQTSSWDGEKLTSIFQKVQETQIANSSYTKTEFDEKFDLFKIYENKSMRDNDYCLIYS